MGGAMGGFSPGSATVYTPIGNNNICTIPRVFRVVALSALLSGVLLSSGYARTTIKQNRATSVVGPSLSLFNNAIVPYSILSKSFYAHLKSFLFSRTAIGNAPEL